MKSYRIVSVMLGMVMCVALSLPAVAQVKKMPDGELFDAEYYAEKYPDVAKVYGTDEMALYSHYLDYGKKEGRIPYEDKKSVRKTLPANIDFGNKCVLIVGDSRACSLSRTLNDYCGFKLLYAQNEGSVTEVVLQKGKTLVAICGEGGGSYKKGSFNRAVKDMNELLVNDEMLKKRSTYYYIDMFGVNDINETPNAPLTYLEKDEIIADNNPGIIQMYHFNAGPITEDGYFYLENDLSNETIEKYNEQFKNTEKVQVIDLFSYLMTNGFDTVDDSENDFSKTGMHYDVSTDIEIIYLIKNLVK